ncbi:MAG: hypothetical protein CVU49_03215 [Candidatus Cloacimonetes bacterium HGW-Cloacimonetes-2]|nr:MAG: hypothetical protein CVU49_03215 [Candidatus Cloacimonetes bacterium HGW-Cloacimonetes-2]
MKVRRSNRLRDAKPSLMPTDVILTLEHVSKEIGDLLLLDDLSLGIHSGDKIGVVGVNGSGKTTLLKLLSTQIPPTNGTITIRKGIKTAYLMQDAELQIPLTPLEFVSQDDSAPDEHLCKAMLTLLGITDHDLPMFKLSGGQRRKVDLARVLVREPDLLFLDEPTNHLDLASIEWLQNLLANSKMTVIFVTHDRYFLDAICTRILEIEHSKAYLYEGNYSEYVRGKIIRATDLQRKETRRQAQLKKELDWLNRGAQARSSKPKNHIDRVKELLSKSYLISNAELSISFQTDRLGKTILELHHLSKSLGGKELFHGLEHHFQPGERIGIIGPNGCGKTSLLKIITGEMEPDLGTVKAGINTNFAYYKQEEDSFDPTLCVYDYIAQYAEVIKTRDGTKLTASEMLKRFLFDAKMQQSKLSSLSGGERKRLFLLKSLIFGANFIVLDEPTNDLDIRTLEILEDYLDAFRGCLLIVSHDRFFLDRTVDYLFIFEERGIRKFPGSYSDYLLVHKYEEEEKAEKQVIMRPKRVYKGLSYNEQRELTALEKTIDELELEIVSLEESLVSSGASLSHTDYHNISTRLEELQSRHNSLFERWAELSERA